VFTLKAAALDAALADVSDVPSVEISHGNPTIVFTGNYETPVTDLVEFLSRLQSVDEQAAEAAREGLEWSEGGYARHGSAALNGIVLDGVSRYQECAECGDPVGDFGSDNDSTTCEECTTEDTPAVAL
jgi:hypothetical protein